MRIIFILFLVFSYLISYEARIESVENSSVLLNKSFKNGMSGIVLCPYEDREIICARIIVFENKGELKVYDDLENSAFALPVVFPKKGDRVILGKDYNRVMIIAPNQDSYLKVKSMFKNKTFISPDIFATFLDKTPTKKDFINFAKELNIGLYIFVLDKIYLVDAYSFYAIKSLELKKHYKFEKPFFNTYAISLKGGFFSKLFQSKISNYIAYYKKMIKEEND
jgi:hypothetical protein